VRGPSWSAREPQQPGGLAAGARRRRPPPVKRAAVLPEILSATGTVELNLLQQRRGGLFGIRILGADNSAWQRSTGSPSFQGIDPPTPPSDKRQISGAC
jgi:hypothetical protein